MSGVIYVYSSAYVSATHIYANIHVHTYADSWMLPPKHMHWGVCLCACLCVRACMCIASSQYVSGFSSDTRCRDLKIKSQSVCHLLTPLFSSRSPFNPPPPLSFSHHLPGHLLGNDFCPIGCLQSVGRPIDCRAYARREARWSLMQPAMIQRCQSAHTHMAGTHTHTSNMLDVVSAEPPPQAKCDLKSLNGKWQCYQCADHQTIGNPPAGLKQWATEHYWLQSAHTLIKALLSANGKHNREKWEWNHQPSVCVRASMCEHVWASTYVAADKSHLALKNAFMFNWSLH